MKKDWCSFSPDKILGYDVSSACEVHDMSYNRGGRCNWEEIKKVDEEFRENLALISNVWIAWTYYSGVRIFARFTQFLHWLRLY